MYLFLLVTAHLLPSSRSWGSSSSSGVQLPDGERYRRMNVQGPFVPLSAEGIEADRKRIESRCSSTGEPQPFARCGDCHRQALPARSSFLSSVCGAAALRRQPQLKRWAAPRSVKVPPSLLPAAVAAYGAKMHSLPRTGRSSCHRLCGGNAGGCHASGRTAWLGQFREGRGHLISMHLDALCSVSPWSQIRGLLACSPPAMAARTE